MSAPSMSTPVAMANTKSREANPSWATPSRQFVPLHLQPGAARSSFARPDTYNLHRPKTNPQLSATSPQRSGFATKPKSKARRSGISLDTEDELPPTRSIRVLSGPVEEAEVPPVSGGSTPISASQGTPVIVFGFPPGSTQTVLQFFGGFGEITENVAGSDSHAAAAIECGRNWLRITYRDRDAAQRALAQNGHVMPGQYVIGCVPGEPGEYSSTMQQSSTNSMLLDESDVSLIQEHSMASVLDEPSEDPAVNINTDHTSSASNSLPVLGSFGFNSNSPSNGSSNGPESGAAQNSDASSSASSPKIAERIVPREMSNNLFRETTTAKPAVKMMDINTTKLPEKTAPSGLFGRVSQAVSHALFDWDV